ncbi:MAG: ParB N-terminal domain-containing protein [Candidatus Hydrogenedentes bacterium]|nr:ParB N-terminal domain-containing protein [Candidatus Hydrogenedentota bacterium]
MKIETWPIDKVIPYARNPRKNDASVDGVAASIKEFGWRVPIVVDEAGVIITGHTRLKAARRLGMDKVPVHVATDLTPAQVKAYRIADNSAGSKSEWDADLLKIELDDLPDFDAAEFNLDLDALGMDDAPEGEADAEPQIDRAEELNKKWKVKSGDLFRIGEHKLLCGDSTKREDVERVTNTECESTIADPPYNVGLDYGEETDDVRKDEIFWAWQSEWFELCKAFTKKQVITPGCVNLEKWINIFEPDHVAVWDKGEGANTYGRVTKYWAWEPLMCHGKFERKRHTDVFRYSALGENPGHPCPKPLTLWTEIIDTLLTGDVYEPFCGSGTTMVACQNLSRKCRAIEISPNYCAVILERMATAFPELDIHKVCCVPHPD